MKVTGFTFIRNAIKFDYPVAEAIRSILPLCDDFVVAVGNSDDNTEELIRNIDRQKIIIVNTIWDESPEMKILGKVFASETNKAIKAIPDDSDWAFYIQGDEAVHEKYLGNIHTAMEKWNDDKDVDGLLFNYLHFYGSYDYVGVSQRWYRNEVRIIRNDKTIYSFRDAQGFRKGDNKKLKVKPVNAWIYHYGWVKEPEMMVKKIRNTSTFYEGIEWLEKAGEKQEFDYSSIDALNRFTDTHPEVMRERIRQKNWTFNHDLTYNKLPFKYMGKLFLKKYLHWNTFYENFTLI